MGPNIYWYDMIWYDMIWYDMIWYDMIWYKISKRLSKVSLLPMVHPNFFFFSFSFLFFFFLHVCFFVLFLILFIFCFFFFFSFYFFTCFFFFFFPLYTWPKKKKKKKKKWGRAIGFQKDWGLSGPSPFFFLSFFHGCFEGRSVASSTNTCFAALVILLNWNSQLFKIRFCYSMFLKLLL